MEPLAATAGLIAVGAITPGPNNLIVLRVTAAGGWRSALPAMIGIVAGGLALLVAVVAGARGLVDGEPRLAGALSAGACLLLAALGLVAIARTFASDGVAPDAGPLATVTGFGGLFAFQFFNPKAWLLVVAAVTSTGSAASSPFALAQLAALFVLIPTLSLALWSCAGVVALRHLARPPFRNWFERVTGTLLVAFATALFLGVLDAF